MGPIYCGDTIACDQRNNLLAVKFCEGIREHDQTTIRLARLSRNERFEFAHVINGCNNRLHAEGGSSGFERVRVTLDKRCRLRVKQQGDLGDAGCAISFTSSAHLPPNDPTMGVKPVTLPPGRGRLATNPLPTGSATSTKMTGIVRVACTIA